MGFLDRFTPRVSRLVEDVLRRQREGDDEEQNARQRIRRVDQQQGIPITAPSKSFSRPARRSCPRAWRGSL